MPYTYDYPRPALTVDCMLLAYTAGQPIEVLLIQRGKDPFKHHWALPGGFVDEMEDLPVAARRELAEETGIQLNALEQFAAFGKPGRDPRGHVVSVAHWALIDPAQHSVKAADDASNAQWFPISDLPTLAFDHAEIIASGLHHIHVQSHYRPLGLNLLEETFRSQEWIDLNRQLLVQGGLSAENLSEQFAHWKKLGIFLPVSTNEQEVRFRVDWQKMNARSGQPGSTSDEK